MRGQRFLVLVVLAQLTFALNSLNWSEDTRSASELHFKHLVGQDDGALIKRRSESGPAGRTHHSDWILHPCESKAGEWG